MYLQRTSRRVCVYEYVYVYVYMYMLPVPPNAEIQFCGRDSKSYILTVCCFICVDLCFFCFLLIFVFVFFVFLEVR